MNWNRVVKLALVLFVAQVTIGFLDGVLSSPDASMPWLFVGDATSFVVCSVIFAFFARRQSVRPFAHAWFGLTLQVVVAVVVAIALGAWLGGTSWFSIAMEWIVLICAFAVGTSAGIAFRHNASRPADA